jgi:hypothetical protein
MRNDVTEVDVAAAEANGSRPLSPQADRFGEEKKGVAEVNENRTRQAAYRHREIQARAMSKQRHPSSDAGARDLLST